MYSGHIWTGYGSLHIQHQIATALARVVDNPSATWSFSKCRCALVCWQEAWDNYKPQFTTTSKVSCNCVGCCFPPQPEQSFNGPWSCISPLLKQLCCELITVAVCLKKMILLQLESSGSCCNMAKIIYRLLNYTGVSLAYLISHN